MKAKLFFRFLEELETYKRVFIPKAVMSYFVAYCTKIGYCKLCGGALKHNERGELVGRYFYID